MLGEEAGAEGLPDGGTVKAVIAAGTGEISSPKKRKRGPHSWKSPEICDEILRPLFPLG